MTKNSLFILLFLLSGIFGWSCSGKETIDSVKTENNESGNLEESLMTIYQGVNSTDAVLDSAWVISKENSGDKMLKLYGQKNIEGKYESITTYIQIKADDKGNYQPVPAGNTGALVVSCVSKKCNPCDLKDIWTEKAYCDCNTPDPGAYDFECNMNSTYSTNQFKIPETAGGLIYSAEK